LLTLFESLDDPFVGRPWLVEGPGDKLLPDGDGLFSPAADVGEGRGGYSLAGGLSGVGIEDEEIALASEQIQKVAKREISLVGIEPFINPFLTIRGSSRRIPASISKLLGTGIVTKETARSLESYIKAQREFDASILEPVREPEKKQSFLSRFFGKWDGGR